MASKSESVFICTLHSRMRQTTTAHGQAPARQRKQQRWRLITATIEKFKRLKSTKIKATTVKTWNDERYIKLMVVQREASNGQRASINAPGGVKLFTRN